MLHAMRRLHFYVDIDDVLAETTRALAEMARTRFGKNVAFEEIRVFDLSRSLDLDEHEFPAFMGAAHEPDFLLNLDAVPGARTVLKGWRAADVHISMVTGRPAHCRPSTLEWLRARDLPFDALEFVDKYGRYDDPEAPTPAQLCQRGYHTVVEDADAMALYLVTHTDARVLLYDRPWNRKSQAESRGARRVHGWAEVEQFTRPSD